MHLPSVSCPPALWPGPAETRGHTAVVFFMDSSRFKCPEHPDHRTLVNFGRTAFVGARWPCRARVLPALGYTRCVFVPYRASRAVEGAADHRPGLFPAVLRG